MLHLCCETTGVVFVGFLFLSRKIVPNMPPYRPDCLFQAVKGILGAYPSRRRSRPSKDLQDGSQIKALENGLMLC